MSQIIKKFIQDNAAGSTKVRLENNLPLRSRNAADTADVEILKVTNADILEFLREVSMGNNKIVNLADPTSALDAVNKQYLESVIAGLRDPKDAARAATTAALPAVTYAAGVLTADAVGALPSQDGIGLSVGDRLLVKDQVSQLENGIYEVTVLGDGSTEFELTRTVDADTDDEVTQGMLVPVAEGTLNGGLGFILTTPDPIVVGTTGLNFIKFGESVQAGLGLQKVGQTLSVDNGDGLDFSGNTLVVLVDEDLVDGTTKINAGGNVAGRKTFRASFTLTGTDISNGYVDLTKVASRDSIIMQPAGGPKQNEILDFTVSYQGGASSKSRVTFAGDLIGPAALASGDVLYFSYASLDY